MAFVDSVFCTLWSVVGHSTRRRRATSQEKSTRLTRTVARSLRSHAHSLARSLACGRRQKTLVRCYSYRAMVAQGNYLSVQDEVDDASPVALRAVKLLAAVLSGKNAWQQHRQQRALFFVLTKRSEQATTKTRRRKQRRCSKRPTKRLATWCACCVPVCTLTWGTLFVCLFVCLL